MIESYKLKLASQVAMFCNRLGMLDGYRFLRTGLVKSQVAILMYHRVVPQRDNWFLPFSITVADFENHLKYLTNQYTILSLDELVGRIYEKKSLPKKAAVITFDDGYKDNYIYAYPILKRYSVPATVFLIAGHIDSGELFWWDKIMYVLQHTACRTLELDEIGLYSLRSNDERRRVAHKLIKRLTSIPEQKKKTLIERIVGMSAVNIPAGLSKEMILSWDNVREMNHGGVAIGAHSMTHPRLAKLSPEQAKYEIIQSKKVIEERTGQPVTAFAYPHGIFSNDTTSFLKESGLRCALTSDQKMVTSQSNPYELGRIIAMETLGLFKTFLFGLHSDLDVTMSNTKEILEYGAKVVSKSLQPRR